MKRTMPFLALLMLISVYSFGQTQSEQVNVVNKGIGGNSSADLLARIDKDVFQESPDLVILMVGTNDLINTHKMVSIDRFKANMNSLLNQLSEKNIPTLLVSPPTLDPVYLYERHDSTKYDIKPLDRIRLGRDAMKQISKERNIPFVDVFNYLECLDIPQHNMDDIIMNEKNSDKKDGIHFTKKGNELLALYIYTHLKAKFSLFKGIKIVCFGDSLTNSVYMLGAGTSEGDTYPAILKRLISNEIMNK